MRTKTRPPALLFFVAVLMLVAFEVARIYWIMPFPGSQQGGTLELAYALHRFIVWERVVIGLLALFSGLLVLKRGGWVLRIAAVLALALVGVVAWQANGPMAAEVMFREPAYPLQVVSAPQATLPDDALVVGVAFLGGDGHLQARAYPMRYVAYHHQMRDVMAGQPLMVTYCTVCRTGRVYDPTVEGAAEDFRLVGMDQFNAMFEDRSTGSWWRQATGEAVTGPRKGQVLKELASSQVSWGAWKAQHPDTGLMAPDPAFAATYERYVAFEQGTSESTLTGRNKASWEDKSWVVGVLADGRARAFDWNELAADRLIRDQIGERPMLLTLGADGQSFHAFDARPPGWNEALQLETTGDPGVLLDPVSGARWSSSGRALDGPLAGAQLEKLPAYQEFWHSWRTFRPDTSARRPGG